MANTYKSFAYYRVTLKGKFEHNGVTYLPRFKHRILGKKLNELMGAGYGGNIASAVEV